MADFRKQNWMSVTPLLSESPTVAPLVQSNVIDETDPVPGLLNWTVQALMSVTVKSPLTGSTFTHHCPLPEARWISVLGGTVNTRAGSWDVANPGQAMDPTIGMSSARTATLTSVRACIVSSS